MSDYGAPLRARPLAASLALHAAILLATLSLRFAPAEPTPRFSSQRATLVAPRLSPPPARRMPAVPATRHAPRVPPKTFQLPQPALHAEPARPPEPAVLAPEPRIEVAPAPVAVARAETAPVVLPPPVKTGVLGDARAATPAQTERLDAIRSSGFPSAEAAGQAVRTARVAAAGGFGAAQAAKASALDRTVTSGVFGEARIASPEGPRAGNMAPAPDLSPVEIVFKPRPEYTTEARMLRLEGEVLLEVLFPASGKAQVLRVVRGLGHGLDEAAAAAAQQIRFRPARRGGVPVDARAIVHIIFQLAY